MQIQGYLNTGSNATTVSLAQVNTSNNITNYFNLNPAAEGIFKGTTTDFLCIATKQETTSKL